MALGRLSVYQLRAVVAEYQDVGDAVMLDRDKPSGVVSDGAGWQTGGVSPPVPRKGALRRHSAPNPT